MFNPEEYMCQLVSALRERFGSRLAYVGLQGSYLRGEATEGSDIDPMVVIDDLSVTDLDAYRAIVNRLDDAEKSCGFICGTAELANWNPLEICHLLHSTKDYVGDLAKLVPSFTDADARNFVKLSVNNLSHEICHRYLHGSAEANARGIAGSYKQVFFILQNVHYLNSGLFVATQKDLLQRLEGKNKQVLKTAIDLKAGKDYEFKDLFELLYSWCRDMMIGL